MARTVSEIKAIIGNAYIANPIVQSTYNLSTADVEIGFDALFSVVSVENILFYAIAFAINVFELILDAFKVEIQSKIDAAYIANSAWWHAQAMKFQRGYNLVINTTTFVWGYETVDLAAQIIKRVAVRESVQQDGSCQLKLLLATETDGAIAALGDGDKALFSIYANQIKPSGVLLQIISGDGDVVDLALTVNYNALMMNSSGELITDSSKPVELDINNFIDNLNTTSFGGKLNLTKLIDSIQSASAVIDAKITEISINGTVQAENWGTFESTNGWFSLGNMTITYQPQTNL